MSETRWSLEKRLFFTRQVALGVNSGVPLLEALQIVGEAGEGYQEVIDPLCRRLESGTRLSKAMSYHPKVFDKSYLSMIRVGEEGGGLHRALAELERWLERDTRVYMKTRAALTYPAFVASLTVVLTVILFTVVLPVFIEVFSRMGSEIPTPTWLLLGLCSAMRTPWFWLVSGFLGLQGTMLVRHWWSTTEGRTYLYGILTSIPGLGPALEGAALTRYCLAAACLLRGGLDTVRALSLAGAASGSPALQADVPVLIRKIQEGIQVSEHMSERPGIYEPALVGMVSVGEASGTLPLVFAKMADFYEMDVESRLEALLSLLEPLLITVVAVGVGAVVLALVSPLYSYLAELL